MNKPNTIFLVKEQVNEFKDSVVSVFSNQAQAELYITENKELGNNHDLWYEQWIVDYNAKWH